ncbi:hypothetical protein MTO96_030155 [Rhipicephalus appendiculatus]
MPVVTSPEWPGQNQPQCLEFWYSSAAMNSARLQVEVVANGKSEVVWEQPQIIRKEWMLAHERKSCGRRNSRGTRSISLDDVLLRPEPCRHPARCEFTDGLCGYVNKFQGDFRWLVGTGRYENPKLQPAVPRVEDITSANLSVSCYGNTSDPKNADAPYTIKLQGVSQWSVLKVELKRGTRCQLSVSVTRGDGTNGTMAIASVEVERMDTGIKPTEDVDSPGECSFQRNLLDVWSGADRLFGTITRHSHHWDHVLVDFKRPEGKFKVIPGPNSYDAWQVRRALHVGFPDHTTKNMTGRYLHLNLTAIDSHHPVSRVFMQRRPPTNATCVTFWWSGYGAISRLNVYRLV